MLDLDLEIGSSSEPITGTVEPAPALLVTVEQASVQTVFATRQALDPLIEKIAQAVREQKPDVTTAKGRKEIVSLAFRVAKTKTYLDNLGKALVAGLKELPKTIDANRLDMRIRLDALRDEARKPLDEWEAEQERLENERRAQEEAAALAAQIERDHEMALLMDAVFAHEREGKLRAEEQARAEREESARRKAEEREEKARQDAVERERQQLEAEETRKRETQAARERDIEHRRAFNREALEDITACLSTSDIDPAEAILRFIVERKIRHISIAY